MLLGSTWVGIALIGLLVVYLSLTSTLPVPIARGLGVLVSDPAAPVELYRWWPFVAVCLALCANLAIATVVRIPLRWPSVGAWCSHLGLILMVAGSLVYTRQGFSGDSMSIRTRGGWSPIRHAYGKGTFTMYVGGSGGPGPVQTPLPGLHPRSGEIDLDVPLAGGEGVGIRVTKYLPKAHLVETWRNSSPVRRPAARVRVSEAPRGATVVLCPSSRQHRFLGASGYAITYSPDATPETLAKAIDPNAPPLPVAMVHELAMIFDGPDVPPTLVLMRANGPRWHGRLEQGKPLEATVAGRKVSFELLELLTHAEQVVEPGPPPTTPDPHHTHDEPSTVVRVEVTAGDFKRTAYVPYSRYVPDAEQDHLAPVRSVDVPGRAAPLKLRFSRARTPLPATVRILHAEYQTYPASGIPKDYVCQVEIAAGGRRRVETLSLNHPVHVGRFQLSQGSWHEDPSHPDRIILLAATRPALPIIWLGCILICLGFPIAFYVKPLILIRRRSRPE